MRVRELMHAPPVVVHADMPLAEVARTMLERGIGCVPVVDFAGRLVGIVTETDFGLKERGVPFTLLHMPQLLGHWLGPESLERIYAEARTRTAGEVMSTGVATVAEDDTVEEAAKLMLELDVNRLPVVRDGVPVGVIARRDLLRLMVPGEARRASPAP